MLAINHCPSFCDAADWECIGHGLLLPCVCTIMPTSSPFPALFHKQLLFRLPSLYGAVGMAKKSMAATLRATLRPNRSLWLPYFFFHFDACWNGCRSFGKKKDKKYGRHHKPWISTMISSHSFLIVMSSLVDYCWTIMIAVARLLIFCPWNKKKRRVC